MKTRYFALFMGLIHIALGVLSMIPQLQRPRSRRDPKLKSGAEYSYWLDIFPVNMVHSLLHVVVGVIGLAASAREKTARLFAQGMVLLFTPLTLMGIAPDQRLNTMFGITPLWGPDNLIHTVMIALSAFFGFVLPQQQQSRISSELPKLSRERSTLAQSSDEPETDAQTRVLQTEPTYWRSTT